MTTNPLDELNNVFWEFIETASAGSEHFAAASILLREDLFLEWKKCKGSWGLYLRGVGGLTPIQSASAEDRVLAAGALPRLTELMHQRYKDQLHAIRQVREALQRVQEIACQTKS